MQIGDGVVDAFGTDVFDRDDGGPGVRDGGRLVLPAGRVEGCPVSQHHPIRTIAPGQRVTAVDRHAAALVATVCVPTVVGGWAVGALIGAAAPGQDHAGERDDCHAPQVRRHLRMLGHYASGAHNTVLTIREQ